MILSSKLRRDLPKDWMPQMNEVDLPSQEVMAELVQTKPVPDANSEIDSMPAFSGIQSPMPSNDGLLASGAMANAVGTSVSHLMNTYQSYFNAKLAPDTIYANGDFIPSIATGAYDICYRVTQVNDIDRVAWKYHKYGYKVKIPLYNVMPASEFFETILTRRIWNFVQMDCTECHLANAIESDDIVADLSARLNSGVRFWVKPNEVEIGDYRKDNTEK